MNPERLLWGTPAGAMLWEIWARHKWNFAAHGAALLAGLISARWLRQETSETAHAVLQLVLVSLFLGSYLDLLTCFGYIEADAQKVHLGYPLGLLLKPVGTAQLVLVPMLSGGSALVLLLWLWSHWVLQSLIPANVALSPLWLGAVNLSFFWWTQALAWSLPRFPGRSLVMVGAGIAHLALGLLPLSPLPLSLPLRWLLLGCLLLSAVGAALQGLSWTRHGAWQGGPRRRPPRAHPLPNRAARPPGPFRSAFQAQFWLEWQRQGWLLPGLAGGILTLVLPLMLVIHHLLPNTEEDPPFAPMVTSMFLCLPLLLSAILGPLLARFDQLEPIGPLPVYIAVRPIANGGLVLAKLAMAMVSSGLTWSLMLVLGGAALVGWRLLSGEPLAAGVPLWQLVAGIIATVPVVALLVLITWKNLVAGCAAGLTGRKWVGRLFTGWKAAGLLALMVLGTLLKWHPDWITVFRAWLSTILWLSLGLKLAISIWAFRESLRRNATTPSVIGWIAGGWAVGGAFAAGYGELLCRALQHPAWGTPVALGAFLVLPLAELALAPLALAWNRHR